MKSLSDKELELMEVLWNLKKGFLKDIVNAYPDPKPAYTTISTVVKRLIDKSHIGFEAIGRDKQYYPLLKKESYFKRVIRNTADRFFSDSPARFASFFAGNENLSVEELEEIKQLIDDQIDKKKKP